MPQTARKLAYLQETAEQHPEYREILPLFMVLYQAIDGREGETGISFSFPPDHPAERIAAGLPLITAEVMDVDEPMAAKFLCRIADALKPAVKEGGEELSLLHDAVVTGRLSLQPLLAGCLSRQRKIIEEAAAAIGVSPAIVEFALEPLLKTALEEFAATVPPSRLEGWEESYCPICGSAAGMGELSGEEGKRELCCSTCSCKWPYQRIKCPYCGNEDADSLSYFTAGKEPTRVDVCRKCSRYLKTRDTRRGHDGVPLDAEDLATIHLDLLARKEGFERGT